MKRRQIGYFEVEALALRVAVATFRIPREGEDWATPELILLTPTEEGIAAQCIRIWGAEDLIVLRDKLQEMDLERFLEREEKLR